MSPGGAERSPLLKLLLLAAFLHVPFLAKPAHVDDAVFLRIARQIREKPLDPYGFEYNWSLTPAPMWLLNLHPPLHPYILAAVQSLAGEGELPAHAAYLLFSLGCVALMWLLAKRFCSRPSLPVLSVLLAPAYLASASNLMADLPLLFFWLLAVELHLRALSKGRPPWGAALAASCAAMTKYFGLALVPLLLAHALLDRRVPARRNGPLLLPVLILALWSLVSCRQAGLLHPLAAAGYGSAAARDLPLALATTLAFLGGLAAWPVFLLPFASRLGKGLLGVVLGAALALSLAARVPETIRPLWCAMALAGIFLSALALRGAAEAPGPESRLLGLWLLGTLFFAAFLNWSVNARILLPALFPAALLVARLLEKQGALGALRLWRLALVPTAVLSFLVAAADQGLAGAQRDFALSACRPQAGRESAVYFIGHWGFQHYAEKAGAAAFDYRRPDIPPGSRLCVSTNNTGSLPLPPGLRARVRTLRTFSAPNPYGVQTQDAASQAAGFYSSAFGAVPYSFGRGLEYDTFLLELREP